jgi:phosphatidylserine/phosphatidylglycerophosphate/cardiolipin synthase-like enzyme
MRHIDTGGPFRVHAISGTRVVLIALDLDEDKLKGLHGFAFQRSTGRAAPQFLKGIKFFKDVVPSPKKGDMYSTREQPIQSFIWGDYEAKADTKYNYAVIALYGDIANLTEGPKVEFTIRTEKENDGKHGIWVNRGAIASQEFSKRFHNKALTDDMFNKVDGNNLIVDEETVWLSRGLEEACVGYINAAPAGDALRVCAYEFTYAPVLNALIAALKRGVDVQIIYHKTAENDKAIAATGLPASRRGKQILFERTRPPIPHNKFIVRLERGRKPVAVWTGSTNFTPSGFFGQTNVGHLVTDETTAKTYLDYWTGLSENPTGKPAREAAIQLTPNPENLIPQDPITLLFSPRIADNMLDWYGARVEDAATATMFTAAFTVDPIILRSLGKKMDSVRFVLLEKPPTPESKAAERANLGHLLFSNGAILGKMPNTTFEKKSGPGGTKFAPIPQFPLEEWFVDEELARKDGSGFIFFIHTKFLLIDPLSDDPLVCSGSANFSGNSLTVNDENMLLIRGDTRVADIYLTEFDRIFRHFYFRDVANELAKKGNDPHADLAIHLDPGADWITPYFKDGNFKNTRRLMFFRDVAENWTAKAADDPDVFQDEEQRAKDKRSKRSAGGATSGAATKRAKKTPRKAAKKRSTAKRSTAKRSSGRKPARKTARKTARGRAR